MTIDRSVLVMLVSILFLTACGLGAPAATVTPTIDAQKTSEAQTQAAGAVEATADAAATSEARQTEEAQATGDAQATVDAEASAVAAATGTREAINSASTASVQGTRSADATATAEALAEATALAGSMLETLEGLAADGTISTTDGEYLRLLDFNESWAQLGWYIFYPTGLREKNFVIRADASWKSASSTADWWNSGCGFVFREDSEINHYLAYLGLDGNAYLGRVYNDVLGLVGQGYYGPLDTPDGEAEIMLAVENENIAFYVNGKRVFLRQDRSLPGGNLHYTIVSGTNKDFGTQCQLSNIDFWALEGS